MAWNCELSEYGTPKRLPKSPGRAEHVETADAGIHGELGLEKRLWMLKALHPNRRDSSSRTDVSNRKGGLQLEPSVPGTAKALSLYDDHGKSSWV